MNSEYISLQWEIPQFDVLGHDNKLIFIYVVTVASCLLRIRNENLSLSFAYDSPVHSNIWTGGGFQGPVIWGI